MGDFGDDDDREGGIGEEGGRRGSSRSRRRGPGSRGGFFGSGRRDRDRERPERTPSQKYVQDLKARKASRFGYNESQQFKKGENPFVSVATAWGEGGAGDIDIETYKKQLKFIFG